MPDARDVADFASQQLRFTTAAAYDVAVAGGRSAFFPAAINDDTVDGIASTQLLMSPLARRACLARARAAPLAAASASDAAAKGCQRLKPTVEIVIKQSGHSYEEKDELVLKCSHGGISFVVPLAHC